MPQWGRGDIVKLIGRNLSYKVTVIKPKRKVKKYRFNFEIFKGEKPKKKRR